MEKGEPWSSSRNLGILLLLSMSLTNIAWRTLAQHRGIIPCSLRALCTEQPCAKGWHGPCSPQLKEKQRTSWPYPPCCQLSSGAQHRLTLPIAPTDAVSTSTHDENTWNSMTSVFCWGTPCLMKLMAILAGGAMFLMMCSAGIWYCWKRKQ